MRLIKLWPTIVLLVNFLDAAPLQLDSNELNLSLNWAEEGPGKSKCRESSWIDNNGQVTLLILTLLLKKT